MTPASFWMKEFCGIELERHPTRATHFLAAKGNSFQVVCA
jgi:hypothetical protein